MEAKHLQNFLNNPRISLCRSLSLWGGAIHDPRYFIWTNLNLVVLRMLHTKSMHSDQWFMRRRFLKIYQNFPYFAPYCALKGPAPLFEQIWILLRNRCLADRRTPDVAPWHKLTWAMLRWAKNWYTCIMSAGSNCHINCVLIYEHNYGRIFLHKVNLCYLLNTQDK